MKTYSRVINWNLNKMKVVIGYFAKADSCTSFVIKIKPLPLKFILFHNTYYEI